MRGLAGLVLSLRSEATCRLASTPTASPDSSQTGLLGHTLPIVTRFSGNVLIVTVENVRPRV